MPRQRSLMTVIRDLVQQEVGSAIQSLHRRLKLHCVTNDTSVMDFLLEALEERLARAGRNRRANG